MLRLLLSARSGITGQGLRFLVAGGATAGVYLVTTTVLADVLGLPFQIALVTGFGAAVCVHFALQRVFVWAHETDFELGARQQAGRYAVVAGAQYGLTAASTSFLPGALDLPVTLVYVATVVVISVVNFTVFRTRVFHAREASPDALD